MAGRGTTGWPMSMAMATQDSGDISAISTLAGGGGTAITSGSYNADADIDRDGDIDSTDYSIANGDGTRAALISGELSSSAVGNVLGFSGYVFNMEVYGGTNGGGTYTIRFRHYDTGLGRWLERDPLEYVDGMSMYGYVSGMPLGAVDPYGKFLNGITGGIGALVGGVVGGAVAAWRGEDIWEGVGVGVIAGGVTGLTFNPALGWVAAGAISGAAGGFAGSFARQAYYHWARAQLEGTQVASLTEVDWLSRAIGRKRSARR